MTRRQPLNLLNASLIITGGVLAAAIATSAFAQTSPARLTDAQYIRAAACAAWEPSAGTGTAVADRVAAEARGRQAAVVSRAEAAADTAARQARRAAGDRLAEQQLSARFAAECSGLAALSPQGGQVAAAH